MLPLLMQFVAVGFLPMLRSLFSTRRAIEIEPTYARAYVGPGDAYGFLGGNDPRSQEESLETSKAAARRALELDETLSEAHASLGLIA
jgi:hypothetical protein